jgi:aromatic ring hydroxylase
MNTPSLEELKGKKSRLEFAIEQTTKELGQANANLDALREKVQSQFGTTDPVALEKLLATCEQEYTQQLEALKELNINI